MLIWMRRRLYMGSAWDRREFKVLLHGLLGVGDARVVSIDIILSKFTGALLERALRGCLYGRQLKPMVSE